MASLLVGYILRPFGYGKDFSPVQIFSIVLMTVGTLVSTFTQESAKGDKGGSLTGTSSGGEKVDFTSLAGFCILQVASLLLAAQGIWGERIQKKHNREVDPSEMQFYSNLLPIPFMYMMFREQIPAQFSALCSSPPLLQSNIIAGLNAPSNGLVPSFFAAVLAAIPASIFWASINCVTAMICGSGAQQLAAKTDSLTVAVVTNFRKLLTFAFSVLYFGNTFSSVGLCGAMVVFMGVGLYAWECINLSKQAQIKMASPSLDRKTQ